MRRKNRRYWSILAIVAVVLGTSGAANKCLAQPAFVPVALSNFTTPSRTEALQPLPVVSRSDGWITEFTMSAAPAAATVIRGADRSKAAPWWGPVASAVIPGAGQFVMGQQRSVAYLVAEAYLVVQAFAARKDYNSDRDEYRTLAADVARRNFGTTRPLGPWEYYEEMEKFDASGMFDMIPGGAIDPETDESTFNGNRWLFARETYWSNPTVAPPDTSAEFARAMAFYLNSAVRDEYRWSWRDAQLQKDVYRQAISSANRNDQRARNMIGLIGANHLASMIDAYVTVRVRRYGGVRVAGMQLDGVESVMLPIGDPANGRMRFRGSVRFVPVSHE